MRVMMNTEWERELPSFINVAPIALLWLPSCMASSREVRVGAKVGVKVGVGVEVGVSTRVTVTVRAKAKVTVTITVTDTLKDTFTVAGIDTDMVIVMVMTT